MVVTANNRLHAHAHETCDWRWNAPVNHSAKARKLAAHEKGSACIDKGTVIHACGDERLFGASLEHRKKEERLRPVGVIVWQRLWYATEAALGGEQA